MKKYLCIAVVCILAAVLTACGQGLAGESQPPAPESTVSSPVSISETVDSAPTRDEAEKEDGNSGTEESAGTDSDETGQETAIAEPAASDEQPTEQDTSTEIPSELEQAAPPEAAPVQAAPAGAASVVCTEPPPASETDVVTAVVPDPAPPVPAASVETPVEQTLPIQEALPPAPVEQSAPQPPAKDIAGMIGAAHAYAYSRNLGVNGALAIGNAGFDNPVNTSVLSAESIQSDLYFCIDRIAALLGETTLDHPPVYNIVQSGDLIYVLYG